jgi:cytokinesis protein
MSDNVTAKKKLENMEKARRAEEERRERIKTQRLRGVDTSDGKKQISWMKSKRLIALFIANQSGMDEDKNIMDNLLDKLRAGELDTSIKRTRNNERSNTSREKRMQKSESVAILAEDLLKSIQQDTEAALGESPSATRSRLAARRNNGSQTALLEELSSM